MKKLSFCIYYFLVILISSNILFSQPKRIISLTPSITQELYFIGLENSVVGITNFCKKVNRNQQVVGTYLQPNIEKILNLKPDIILLSKEGVSKEIINLFDRFKLKYIALEPINNYSELKNQVIFISKLFNKEDFVLKKIQDLETKNFSNITEKENFVLPKKVVFVIDNELLIVASTTSYVGEILNYAKVENMVKTHKKYPQLSVEELTRLDPDILFVSDMGIKENQIKKYFKKFYWLQVVKNNRVIVVDSNIFCQPTIENFWFSVKKVKSWIKNFDNN